MAVRGDVLLSYDMGNCLYCVPSSVWLSLVYLTVTCDFSVSLSS